MNSSMFLKTMQGNISSYVTIMDFFPEFCIFFSSFSMKSRYLYNLQGKQQLKLNLFFGSTRYFLLKVNSDF